MFHKTSMVTHFLIILSLYKCVMPFFLPTFKTHSNKLIISFNSQSNNNCVDEQIPVVTSLSPNTTHTSTFLVDKYAPISLAELSNENIVKIVTREASDAECNELCWKCLGYKYLPSSNEYDNSAVFPKWRAKYPSPPDVIGVTRNYEPEVDRVVRDASINLIRSIPRDFKGSVNSLKEYGFKGFKVNELTPNITRRCQLVSWLLYYREKIHGKTMEDLIREKELQDEANKQNPQSEEFPSEVMFQKLRLDTIE